MDDVTTLKVPAVTKTTSYASTKGPLPKGPGLREGFTDPGQQLQDELSSDRIMNLRADAGEQFIENVRLPAQPGLWIPGYRVITEELARETGLRGMEQDPLPDLEPDQPQPATGAVDGNIVQSFVDGVTGQQKNDVLNACLLAQLAANAKFNRTSQPVEWRSARRSPVSPRLILPAFGCSGGTSFAGSSWHRRWARGGSARGRTRQGFRVAVVPREGTKIHDVIKMLSRDGGATIDCCDGLAIAYHPRGAHWPSQTWVIERSRSGDGGPPPTA